MHFPSVKHTPQGQLEQDLTQFADSEEWCTALVNLTNCNSEEFSQKLLRQLLPATGLCRDSPIDDINGVIAALAAMKPSDPIESLLVAQIISSSDQALKMMAKACSAKTPELAQQFTTLSVRLMSINVKQIDTLARYRKDGTQQIQVNHIHIDNKSQAIIGSVTKS